MISHLTNRRPRTVDTSMHFCPHTVCDSRGWLGLTAFCACIRYETGLG